MEIDLRERLQTVRHAAREGGELALSMFAGRDSLEILSKGRHDRVTEADRKVEGVIRDVIASRFPGEAVLGEEFGAGAADPRNQDSLWVVDPIDGTDCFVFGLPMWSVSVAWMHEGETKAGAVYDPVHDEMYAASLGGGAFLGDTPIRASDATDLGAGLVGIGHSSRVRPAVSLAALERLLEMGGMFHRGGSGALSLAWVGAGRLLGYYEAHINAWDCLAGLHVVREAGGWHSDFLAGDGLVSGNPVLACGAGLRDLMKAVAGESPA